MHKKILILATLLAFPAAAQQAPEAEAEAAYTKTINERAEKIVAPLGLADMAQAQRVRDVIAAQYRALRDLQAQFEARSAEAKKQTPGEAALQTAKNETQLKRDALHKTFVALLLTELSTEQVDKVKDGLTYGVLPLTYGVYLDMLPNLSDAQKRQIKAWLYEAREYAMDAGSASEKHAWFGKYKGRINNYLAAAGINMKQAEKEWAERRKNPKTTEQR